MINPNTFTKEWFGNIKSQNPKAIINPPLLEKMAYALLLAEALKINGLDFIFKGGTSLILLLDTPQRFSIDIDIITQATQTQIENTLQKICDDGLFSDFELDTKRSYLTGIPKAHYKLSYQPIFTNPNDNKILLDILFGKNPYPVLQETSIANSWLNTNAPPTQVSTPTIDSITGDKLTAFAPNTIGILYGLNKGTEIIKQLFDLGQLFDKVIDFEVVTKSFQINAEKELAYRTDMEGKTIANVLDDTLQVCLDVVNETNAELKNGIKAFGSWTIFPFRKEEAFEAVGKIAYMVAKIKKGDTSPLLKFNPETMQIKDFLIQEPAYNFLNKKVKFAHNALFYWWQAVEMLKK